MRELSPLAILFGILTGILFAMTAAFVGLQLGLTVSAAIPATVLSVVVLRSLAKRGTVLECNIAQTVASAGEAMATGMVFTIPALYMLGVEVEWLDLLFWSAVGGLLGVVFMIPLRRALIVEKHDELPYPEGEACGQVLHGAESSGALRTVVTGLGVGAGFSLAQGLGFWRPKARLDIPQIHTSAELNASPALLGLGYVLGPRVAALILGGTVLSWFVLIPLIAAYGGGKDQPVAPGSAALIRDMSPDVIWQDYIRYIGAGAIVLGALVALIRVLPTQATSYWLALRGVVRRGGSNTRTQRDIPFPIIVLLIAGLAYAMFKVPVMSLGTIGIVCALVAGLLLMAVASRLVGRIGNSFNPVSGMTIAAVLATALILALAANVGGLEAKAAAVLAGAIVCTVLSVAGDSAQSLKTGHLVGATPYKQQIAKMVGVLTACVALAWTMGLLDQSYGFIETADTPNALPCYQANLVHSVVDGVIDWDLPWTLLLIGAAAALAVELLGIASLPFAIGLFLPLALTLPVAIGGGLRWLIEKRRKPTPNVPVPGVLASSGLVAGYGIVGVLLAGSVAFIAAVWHQPQYQSPLMDKPEPVSHTHLQPWLADKFGFDPTYWLGVKAAMPEGGSAVPDPAPSRPVTTRSVTTQPATIPAVAYEDLFWFDLLPVVPFVIMLVWLTVAAARRAPPPPPTYTWKHHPPEGPPVTRPRGIGHKGPIDSLPPTPVNATELPPPVPSLDTLSPWQVEAEPDTEPAGTKDDQAAGGGTWSDDADSPTQRPPEPEPAGPEEEPPTAFNLEELGVTAPPAAPAAAEPETMEPPPAEAEPTAVEPTPPAEEAEEEQEEPDEPEPPRCPRSTDDLPPMNMLLGQPPAGERATDDDAADREEPGTDAPPSEEDEDDKRWSPGSQP